MKDAVTSARFSTNKETSRETRTHLQNSLLLLQPLVGLAEAGVEVAEKLLLLFQLLLLVGHLLPGLQQLGLQPPDAVLPPVDLQILLLAALLGTQQLELYL